MTTPTVFECVDFIPDSIHFAIDFAVVAVFVLAGLAVGVWILWWILKARDYLFHLFWMIHCDGWNLYIIADEMNRVLESAAANHNPTTIQETNGNSSDDELRENIVYRWHRRIKPQQRLQPTYKLNRLEGRH